ncbi:MAG: hypothetical protein M3R70_14200 [Actinomycetota bacterium]|nr:hypothetical protein [Actinomycetota bacterium]
MSVAVKSTELAERPEVDRFERPAAEGVTLLGSTPGAALAECTCPEWCEHDHENE